MGYHRPSGATDALGHAQSSTLDLIDTGLASQLLHQLDYLIDARGSYRIPPGLQTTHGANGDPAIQGNLSFLGQAHALPALGEATSFQRKGSSDGESVMHLKEVNIR